jgi:hypothetical protein
MAQRIALRRANTRTRPRVKPNAGDHRHSPPATVPIALLAILTTVNATVAADVV